MEKARGIAIEIMAMFEDFLTARNVTISSQERNNYEAGEGIEKAILFGSDYYELEDEITDIVNWSQNQIQNPKRIKSGKEKSGDSPQDRKIFKARCPFGKNSSLENKPFGLRELECAPERDNG